ncbi:hypothetical protein EV363DRAFT_1296473 [Boletus edulis]|nr:hypothetical protein EV363DRAFT_1296473 [Boletus edulis]
MDFNIPISPTICSSTTSFRPLTVQLNSGLGGWSSPPPSAPPQFSMSAIPPSDVFAVPARLHGSSTWMGLDPSSSLSQPFVPPPGLSCRCWVSSGTLVSPFDSTAVSVHPDYSAYVGLLSLLLASPVALALFSILLDHLKSACHQNETQALRHMHRWSGSNSQQALSHSKTEVTLLGRMICSPNVGQEDIDSDSKQYAWTITVMHGVADLGVGTHA